MNALLTWGNYVSGLRFDPTGAHFGSEALEDLLESVPVAIAVTVGPEHRYVFANRTFRVALQGWTDDPRGRTVAEVMGSNYSPEAAAIRERVLATGEPFEAGAYPVRLEPEGDPTYWDVRTLPVRDLSDQITGILTLGLEVTSLVRAKEEAAERVREAEYQNARLALAVEATALGLWEWDAQTGATFWSPRQREVFGLPVGEEPSYEFWLSVLHPEDRDRVVRAVTRLMDPTSGGHLDLEHRVVHPTGQVRWVLSRGRMIYEEVEGELRPIRLLGTVLVITERRQAEEERQLLLRETDHRVMNLFAMTNAMIGMTARSSQTPAEMAQTLSGRINALARAHELIRPAIVQDQEAARPTTLRDLLAVIVAPHADGDRDRVCLTGPELAVGSRAATALTLLVHELATNAAKYGALSWDAGRVEVQWRQEGTAVEIRWQELGGPTIEEPPQRQGFGSRLVRGSLAQLGGTISHDWSRSGLCVVVCLSEADLRR